MSLAAGSTLDQYRLLEKIGEGGMGVVWKARDTTLDRDVAIKLLPTNLVHDADRLARFEREAKAVAALSHPNIVAIYGFGSAAGVTYAAIELLEGRTLREHLIEGPLPTRKAIEIAGQIAAGLNAAHAKGIVHRDLKPENVFLTPEGRARILDFGLAAIGPVAGAEPLDDSGATRTELTTPGAVMGTVEYMSPEQVRGAPADSRSDIFALGVMLHEMLSGARPFTRPTAAETMTAVLREDPPELRTGGRPASPALVRVLARCLEKAPEERFQNARDLAFALDNATLDSSTQVSSAPAAAAPKHRARGSRAWVGLTLAAVIGFGLGWLLHRAPDAVPPEPARLTQITFTGSDYQPSVSPDGRLIAFTSGRSGISQIWLRQVEGGGEHPLTDGPDWRPHFSADGASVIFIRDEGESYAAYRVPVVGGQARKLLADVSEAALSPDGKRLAYLRGSTFGAASPDSQLGLLDLETGEERRLHQLTGADFAGIAWSPAGNRIATTGSSPQGGSRGWVTYVLDVAGGSIEKVPISGGEIVSVATWSGPDALLAAVSPTNVSGTTEPAAVYRYDLTTRERRALFWTPYLFPFRGSSSETTRLGLIGNDRLVFDSFRQAQTLRLIDPSNGSRRELLRGDAIDRQPVFSPDGSRVLFTSNRAGNVDLFTYELASGKLLQLTDHPMADWDGAYTPDGRSILWGSSRSGALEVWIADADGSNPRQVTQDGLDAENPTMTADGEWIVYSSGNPEHLGLFKIRSDGSDAQQLVPGNWVNPEVSPDGRYVLYVSTDASRQYNELSVAEVATGRVTEFSVGIQYEPRSPNVTYGRGRWMPDGKTIAYIGLDDEGRTGVLLQEFASDRDTSDTRRPWIGFRDDQVAESFAISPDGRQAVLSTIQEVRTLSVADRLPNLR